VTVSQPGSGFCPANVSYSNSVHDFGLGAFTAHSFWWHERIQGGGPAGGNQIRFLKPFPRAGMAQMKVSGGEMAQAARDKKCDTVAAASSPGYLGLTPYRCQRRR